MMRQLRPHSAFLREPTKEAARRCEFLGFKLYDRVGCQWMVESPEGLHVYLHKIDDINALMNLVEELRREER